ncbi:MAG: hypothetical protein H0V29_05720 [Thermoleophilaceae bacterium]|nr:hypothetical protein [Thermoleophilaceae bacterium]
MNSLFCRHNRFTADCPICSKGTVLETKHSSTSGARKPAKPKAAPAEKGFRGPYSSAGPYEREAGEVTVRLEKVPGGVRLAEWGGGKPAPRAPVLPAGDLRALVLEALDRELFGERDADALRDALAAEPDPQVSDAGPDGVGSSAPARPWGASGGRAGDMLDQLRVEALEAGDLRVARWIQRPRAEWELVDAPPMLPGVRYAVALADASARGLI